MVSFASYRKALYSSHYRNTCIHSLESTCPYHCSFYFPVIKKRAVLLELLISTSACLPAVHMYERLRKETWDCIVMKNPTCIFDGQNNIVWNEEGSKDKSLSLSSAISFFCHHNCIMHYYTTSKKEMDMEKTWDRRKKPNRLYNDLQKILASLLCLCLTAHKHVRPQS